MGMVPQQPGRQNQMRCCCSKITTPTQFWQYSSADSRHQHPIVVCIDGNMQLIDESFCTVNRPRKQTDRQPSCLLFILVPQNIGCLMISRQRSQSESGFSSCRCFVLDSPRDTTNRELYSDCFYSIHHFLYQVELNPPTKYIAPAAYYKKQPFARLGMRPHNSTFWSAVWPCVKTPNIDQFRCPANMSWKLFVLINKFAPYFYLQHSNQNMLPIKPSLHF